MRSAPKTAESDCPRAPSVYRVVICLLVLLAMTSTGCVRRRLTVRTNPPGALVYVDNQRIGTTPCSVDFTYYGTREIRMVKPGYETLTVNQPIPTPWYETPGIDFISENLVPVKIRDNRTVAYNLTPQRLVPAEELIGRGEQLRGQAQAPPAVVPAGATDPFTPLPATAITPAVPTPAAPLTPPQANAASPFRY
ncbi:MAG: PEGA domain-containing protein [Planctomycetota bacterium]